MENKTKKFLKTEILARERNVFFTSIILISLGYVGITFWLNTIRATAPITFVWVLIIIQFTLYILIFSTSYMRFKGCGYKRFGIIPFLVLAILGRVDNWELLIIPVLIITMVVISGKNKNISSEMQYLIKD